MPGRDAGDRHIVGGKQMKGKARLFKGLTALFAWLLILTVFGANIANNYSSTINSFLGISTTRIVETGE